MCLGIVATNSYSNVVLRSHCKGDVNALVDSIILIDRGKMKNRYSCGHATAMQPNSEDFGD